MVSCPVLAQRAALVGPRPGYIYKMVRLGVPVGGRESCLRNACIPGLTLFWPGSKLFSLLFHCRW